MALLQWSHAENHTVAASGNVDLELYGPLDLLCLTIAKVSGGNVTALTLARSLDGGLTYGPARTVTLGAALASAGDAVDADFVDECPTHVRLGFTVSASTVVKITGRAVSR